MKTRIQKLLLGAALVAATTLAQAQFTYTNNGNGTCTITGYTGPGGAVTIPNSINGLSVVSIGYEAFHNNMSLTSVMIPNSVTSIGSVAFEFCTNLTSVTIPGSVTNIGPVAFASCTSLTAITVDPANSFYSSPNGVLFDKNQTTLIQCPAGKTGSYVIPDSVTSIGYTAFDDCTYLTSVTIPASVTNIGDYAFESCTSLTSITIPGSVTSIGDYAFYYCTSLTSVTIPGSVTRIGDDAFEDCYGLTNVTIGNGITGIGGFAFTDCTNLTSVTIPGSVTSFGGFTFAGCTGLTRVTIANGVTNIGSYAFYDCPSLTSVTIPGTVSGFGDHAFAGCPSLTAAYFRGNAPGDQFGGVFDGGLGDFDPVTVYYLPGATGWGPFFSGVPTELWNPQASALRVTGGNFGFDISGPSYTVIVVEACTNLAQPLWLPVSTNALNGSGASSFSDSQSGNYPARFYRFRSP